MRKIENLQDFYQVYEVDHATSLDKDGGSIYVTTQNEETLWASKITEVHFNFDDGLFLERYTIAQTLDHENLLKYKERYRFVEGALIYNVALMPIVEQGNLDELLPDLVLEEKHSLSEQIIDGLYYLHEHNIAWQNLSAKHLLIEERYNNYVAKFINYGNKKRIPLAFFKDYEYLAPEQFDVNSSIDLKADIWALGVLLYKIWSGRMPFGEKTASLPNAKIKERILGEWQTGLIDTIPEPYRNITKKCLVKNKDARWSDCGQIIVELKKWYAKGVVIQENSPVVEESAIGERKIKRVPNKPIVWWHVLVYMFLAAILGCWISTF